MKKSTILLSLVLSLSATAAFAADITGSTTIGGGSFTPSSKVGIKILSTATSYAATSAHVSGTFEYGTVGGAGVTGDPSKILKKAYTHTTNTADAAAGNPTAPASATALAAGYTE